MKRLKYSAFPRPEKRYAPIVGEELEQIFFCQFWDFNLL